MNPFEVDEIDYAIYILEEALRNKRKHFLGGHFLPNQESELIEEVEFLKSSIKLIKEKFEKDY